MIIGSREMMCVNDEIKKKNYKGVALNNECATFRKQNKCKFYNAKNQGGGFKKEERIMDLEEIVTELKNCNSCPYYFSKRHVSISDIVFMPYNYITDENIRGTLNIRNKDTGEDVSIVNNNILIFDEAHNIEKCAEEGSSFSFSAEDLKEFNKEIEKVGNQIEYLKKKNDDAQYKPKPNNKKGGNKEQKPPNYLNEELEKKVGGFKSNLEDIKEVQEPIGLIRNKMVDYVKNTRKGNPVNEFEIVDEGELIFTYILSSINAINRNSITNYNQKSESNKPIFKTTETGFKNGLNPDNFEKFITKITQQKEDFMAAKEVDAQIKNQGREVSTDAENETGADLAIIDKVTKVLSQIYLLFKNYEKSKLEDAPPFTSTISHYKLLRKIPEKSMDNLVLNLMCQNPGLCFKNINEQKPKSIILTSGTLTPFDSYESELETKFDVKYVGKHIIDNQKQLRSYFIKNAKNTELKFDYSNRDNEQMIRNLGKMMLNTFRLVPNGVLVFFPSYHLMNQYVNIWKKADDPNDDNSTSTYEQFEEKKTICRESRDPEWQRFAYEKFLSDYNTKGAVFFGIYGGKLSEGIDFTDDMARCVINIGIPFPNLNDKRIKAKKEYIDKILKAQENLENKTKFLTGREWYNSQAMRLTNQAIGRSIRHIHDYGTVILADKRWEVISNREHISDWVTQYIEKVENWPSIFSKLPNFYRDISQSMKQAKTERDALNPIPDYCNRNFGKVEIEYERKRTDKDENLFLPMENFQQQPIDDINVCNNQSASMQNNTSKEDHGLNFGFIDQKIGQTTLSGNKNPSNYRRDNMDDIPELPAENLQQEKNVRRDPKQPKSANKKIKNNFNDENVDVDDSKENPTSQLAVEHMNKIFPGFAEQSKSCQKDLWASLEAMVKGNGSVNANEGKENFGDVSKVAVLGESKNSQKTPRLCNNLSKDDGKNQTTDNHKNKIACPICYESNLDVTGGMEFYSSKCGHIICKHCWEQCIKTKKKCPMCNVPVKRMDKLTKVFI